MVNSAKGLTLFFSLVMFCYQMQIAVDKLLNPSLVDSTKNIKITDIDPPLITFCPHDQWNYTQEEYSYMPDLLKGSYGGFWSENIGWGAQLNMSFKQMRKQLPQVDELHIDIRIKKGIRYVNAAFEKRFYPKYGICFDVVNYTIGKDIDLSFTM